MKPDAEAAECRSGQKAFYEKFGLEEMSKLVMLDDGESQGVHLFIHQVTIHPQAYNRLTFQCNSTPPQTFRVRHWDTEFR